jgi:acetyl esterase/lipase
MTRVSIAMAAVMLAMASGVAGEQAVSARAQPSAPALRLVVGPKPAGAPPEEPLYPGPAPGSETAAVTETWAQFIVGGSSQPIVYNVTRPTFSVWRPKVGQATGAAVVLAPGGGYSFLSMESEGWLAAQWLADRGVTAFVLKYRLNEMPADPDAFVAALFSRAGSGVPDVKEPRAVADALAMVRLLRANPERWGIDPRRIGMLGFSAGARTVLGATLTEDRASRADFIGLLYPPMAGIDVPPDAPPVFLAIARDDVRFTQAGFGLAASWHTAGRPLELHLYDAGGHGFGMRPQQKTSDHWIDQFLAWMDARGILRALRTP